MQDDVEKAALTQLRKGTLELAVLLALHQQCCFGLQLFLLNTTDLVISAGCTYLVLRGSAQ